MSTNQDVYDHSHTKKEDEWHEGDEGADGVDPDVIALAASYVPGSAAEKAFVRKIDKRIMPCVWVLYTFSYLDRANIGNAKTGGMEKALGLTSTQYSIVLLVFFVSYVLFEIPSNLIIARVRPSLYLSGLCVIFGGIAASMGAVQNWQQLAAVRFCLGVAEAGFAPGVAFYLSSWYKRYELATRFSIYYTATAVSGAFSGLLAGVITQHLDGARGIAGWRWLFIIEGVASSGIGCITWFFMLDWPSTSSLLTPEEKLLAAQRLAADGLANTGGAQGHMGHWQAVKLAVTDWRTYAFTFLYMLCTGAQTIQYFVPTLVGSLGWTGFVGQYHTIPLYASAFVCILGFCYAADRLQKKPQAICLGASLGTVFFIIVVATTKKMVQYVFLIFAFGTVYALPPLTLTWVPNVLSHPAEKRAVAIAFVNALGNSASLYGVFLWPKTDAPRYIPGFSATTIFMALIAVGSIVLMKLLQRYPAEQHDSQGALQMEMEKQRARGQPPITA